MDQLCICTVKTFQVSVQVDFVLLLSVDCKDKGMK